MFSPKPIACCAQTGELPDARLEAAGYLAPEHKNYLQRDRTSK